MSKLNGICPHIPSSNPEVSKAFFCELLGFKVTFQHNNYIELEKDGHIIGIQQSQGKPNQQSIYFRLEGLNEFWETQKDKLSDYKHREPFEQEYGMREIHVVVPETATLLFIGESVNA